ncbi:MAG: hypothetical protein U0326_40045 [Polyangiales bacterium]
METDATRVSRSRGRRRGAPRAARARMERSAFWDIARDRVAAGALQGIERIGLKEDLLP